MNCKYASSLNRYLDNELTLEEKGSLDEHIKTCRSCAQEVKFMQTIKQGLIQNRVESEPQTFWQNLKNRLPGRTFGEQESPELDFGAWARRLIPVPVAVAIAALIFFYLIPIKQNVIDEYLFGTNFSNVSGLIEEPAGQSGLDTLLY